MTVSGPVHRRHLLTGAALGTAGLALPTLTGAPSYATVGQGVRQGRQRIGLPSGVQSGDVTTTRATLWARADRPGRLVARLSEGRRRELLRGPRVDRHTDLTGRLDLSGLRPGREYDAELWFEGRDGTRGQVGRLSFSTADERPSGTSFVFTGDTAGQGWGINPDLGGMTAYAAMHRTKPDFFVHCGDTIYADGELKESVTEPDGQVWRNLVTPEVAVVAQTLPEFRGRHRYNLMDDNVRAFYADTPLIAQWDDHETVNNWYPGEILDDPRYSERSVDVLAARARRAWQEYQPIRTEAVRGRGRDGFAAARIYRKIERGPQLDLFCLDMRTEKSPNTPGLEPSATQTFGADQVDWLVRGLRRSTATWKVISADLPLGLVVPDGTTGQESISNGDPGAPLGRELELARLLSAIKRHRIKNVVWITADVHYCAAHHYSPERAAFTDFDPFWEIVAGPINAGTFGPNKLDATFGPEVVFQKAADYPGQSPRGGNQFFGHAEIHRDDRLTLSLRNGAGSVLWTHTLEPQGR